MALAPSPGRPRRAMAFALLATTAAAALLGGCTQTGPFARFSNEPKLAAPDSIGAVAQWSEAYTKNPEDPKAALGYANALKALGSRDRALEVLSAAFRANPTQGEIAAELGRLALDMGRPEIAMQTLRVGEAQGVKDWKTLSAQGTLRAKQGKHAEAQQYYLAALKEKPDAVSVINNLALSYALDGKADKSEALLRKAVASGNEDKRVRQNLALVLGLQGKFDEARQVASVDMTEQEAKTSLSYLQNMLSKPTQFAAAGPAGSDDDWTPFAAKYVKGDPTGSKWAPAEKPLPERAATSEVGQIGGSQ
jgi:Flp pilus assembly protein TadD